MKVNQRENKELDRHFLAYTKGKSKESNVKDATKGL